MYEPILLRVSAGETDTDVSTLQWMRSQRRRWERSVAQFSLLRAPSSILANTLTASMADADAAAKRIHLPLPTVKRAAQQLGCLAGLA